MGFRWVCTKCDGINISYGGVGFKCKYCGHTANGLEPTGIKNDSGKTRYDLIDWPFVEGMAEVLTLGADKYSDDNWKRVKPFRSRYVGAAMRHFVAWICGERLDKESGLSHLYHLGCCIMFLAWGDKKEK